MSYFPSPTPAEEAGCLIAAILIAILAVVGLGAVAYGCYWLFTHYAVVKVGAP